MVWSNRLPSSAIRSRCSRRCAPIRSHPLTPRISLVFQRLWEELGLPNILQRLLAGLKFEFSLERVVFITVLHRLFTPGVPQVRLGGHRPARPATLLSHAGLVGGTARPATPGSRPATAERLDRRGSVRTASRSVQRFAMGVSGYHVDLLRGAGWRVNRTARLQQRPLP